MADKKEPMIGQESRPTAVDFNAPVANLTMQQLVDALSPTIIERLKPELSKPEKEFYKPEHFKPEFYKPELLKPELLKPELLKPELSKPFERIDLEQLTEKIADMVVAKMRG